MTKDEWKAVIDIIRETSELNCNTTILNIINLLILLERCDTKETRIMALEEIKKEYTNTEKAIKFDNFKKCIYN